MVEIRPEVEEAIPDDNSVYVINPSNQKVVKVSHTCNRAVSSVTTIGDLICLACEIEK